MTIFEAIVLGIVQGTTEFLPISSSAHLIVVPWLFGWDEPGLTFNVGVHIGTFAAVLLYFRRDLIAMALALPRGLISGKPLADPMSRLALVIILGSVPAAVIGLLAADFIEDFFHGGGGGDTAMVIIGVLLILVGILFAVGERIGRQREDIEAIGLGKGLIIGVAQATALLPGVSRSGSTITAGLFLGLRRDAAARFSFLLGIPAVFGASLFEVRNYLENDMADGQNLVFAIGILTSAVVGYLSIAFLLRFLQRYSLSTFILYRVSLGLLIFSLVALGIR